MIEIDNLEEKKRIAVFYKSLYNKHPTNQLCNSRMYDVWLKFWRKDFEVDGKCLKMWHQKFVESVAKHRNHVEPPAYYAEYNELINSITEFANEHFNFKASQEENHLHCKELLKEYRKNCLNELNTLLDKCNKSDLSVIQVNPNNFMKLAKYGIRQNDSVIFCSEFDDMKEFIINGIEANTL